MITLARKIIEKPGIIRRAPKKSLDLALTSMTRVHTEAVWRQRAVRRRAHSLPAPLVVSITSYPARFHTLAPTLKCLLSQSLRADATVLWLGEGSFGSLPGEVLALQDYGLDIRVTRDLGPFTKIIPSLRGFPDAFIVTADDDAYYGRNWLKQLVHGYDKMAPTVVCHRAHRVRLSKLGRPLSYRCWDWEVQEPGTSPYLFPTGVGGVLYFPGAFSEEVRDEAVFLSLAPKADDLWLYWMERRRGLAVTTLGHRAPIINWSGSQKVGLNNSNVDGLVNNDLYIEKLFSLYGLPMYVN